MMAPVPVPAGTGSPGRWAVIRRWRRRRRGWWGCGRPADDLAGLGESNGAGHRVAGHWCGCRRPAALLRVWLELRQDGHDRGDGPCRPLNYVAVNPKVSCKTPHPSKW